MEKAKDKRNGWKEVRAVLRKEEGSENVSTSQIRGFNILLMKNKMKITKFTDTDINTQFRPNEYICFVKQIIK